MLNEYKSFEDKKDGIKSELGDQIIFNYNATVDGKILKARKRKGCYIELGKDLFLKGFDNQLIGLKKRKRKKLIYYLQIIQRKNLPNKEAIFDCEIINIKVQ